MAFWLLLFVSCCLLWTCSSTFAFAATGRDAFQAQVAPRMFVYPQFVKSTPNEPSAAMFKHFLRALYVCLTRCPIDTGDDHCPGRFDAAFLFVAFKTCRGGHRFDVSRQAAGGFCISSREWSCLVLCVFRLATPPTSTSTRFWENTVAEGVAALHCTEKTSKQKKHYCKEVPAHPPLHSPQCHVLYSCFFFFLFFLPTTFHAESLVYKGPPYIVKFLPSLSIFYKSVTWPEMHSAGIHTCWSGVCVCVWGAGSFLSFFFVVFWL